MATTRLLICGATGFIGRNLLRHFAANKEYQITATYHIRQPVIVPFSHNNIKWLSSDLRNQDDVSSLLDDIDIVIQAAATTSGVRDISSSPYIHVTDNVIMNSLLLRQAFKAQVRHFLFFSCSIMYQSSINPLTESDWSYDDLRGSKYFGAAHTKLYIERMLEFYSSISPMKTTAIRHSNIYGPYDKYDLDRSHFFGATISKILTSSGTITVWGSGEESRDLLYIDDLCEFVDRAIMYQQDGFRLYNCGSGFPYKLNDVVDVIIQASGKKISVLHDLSLPTIKTSFSLDSDMALKELGWSPTTTLADGVSSTVKWWHDNINPINLLPY